MEQLEKPVAAPEPEIAEQDLREELRSMQLLTRGLLVAGLWLSVAVGLYMYRQVTVINRQVAEGSRMVAIYSTNDLPRITWFVNNLQAFASTNQDLRPILAKYNLWPPQNQAAAAPPAAAQPAPANPKK
jgi:hypothetical protein